MPNVFHFDEYDNCLLSQNDSLYCSITFQLYPNENNSSAIWKLIEKTSLEKRNYRHDILRHGICIKETCPDVALDDFTKNVHKFTENLEKCYNLKFRHMGLEGKITKMRCETNESPYPISSIDVVFGAFLVVFILLVLIAWIYDIFASPDFKDTKFAKSKFGKFISIFSLTQNWHRLNKIDLTNPDIRSLRCLQGIRFFCMYNVIAAHCVAANLSIPVVNTRYTEEISERVADRWVGSGSRHAILQTYFMLSSWLLTYQFFVDHEKKEKIKFSYLVNSFVKRYFRITPTLLILVGMCATWLVHLSRGPFWDDIIGHSYRTCRSNWWSNPIYLNNFIHPVEMCQPSLWYIAVDTQYYIVGLFILCLIWKYQEKIALILGCLWVVHVLDTYSRIYSSKIILPIYPELFYNMKFILWDHAGSVAKAPIANMSGLIAGLGFGYTFYKCRNKKLFTKRIHVILWWFASLGVSILIIPIPALFKKTTIFSNNPEVNFAIYACLSRSIYIFGTGFFIFGMTHGQGHIIRAINEWPPMYVLGRLTYSAYLLHVPIQLVKAGLKRAPNYLNDFILNWEMLSDLFLSYMAALFFTLFFELPISELKKHITSMLKNLRRNEVTCYSNKTEKCE
ncbi:nose resistant to fluoxetine protein 6 isoform X2 [Tribolium castaneum]